MRALTVALALNTALAAGPLFGHGPQIQITRDNDKIVTRSLHVEDPYAPLGDIKRVYVIPLLESSGVWYARPNSEVNLTTGQPRYASGPGIAYGVVPGFNVGNRFELNLIDGLQAWNGAGFSDPGAEEVQAYRTNSAGAVIASATTDDSLSLATVATMQFGNIASINPSSHGSASFRLLGNGTAPGGGDNGIYLLSLAYSSTEPAVLASDPFYFVLHKRSSRDELRRSVDGLLGELDLDAQLVQYVPEPSSVSLLAVVGLTIAAGWRRARGHK